jgi:hypothetical protein
VSLYAQKEAPYTKRSSQLHSLENSSLNRELLLIYAAALPLRLDYINADAFLTSLTASILGVLVQLNGRHLRRVLVAGDVQTGNHLLQQSRRAARTRGRRPDRAAAPSRRTRQVRRWMRAGRPRPRSRASPGLPGPPATAPRGKRAREQLPRCGCCQAFPL